MSLTTLPTRGALDLGPVITDTRTPTANELSCVHVEKIKDRLIEVATDIGIDGSPAAGSIKYRLEALEEGGGGGGGLPSVAGQNPGNLLAVNGAGDGAEWIAPPAGAADTILSVTSTDGDTNALVTPQNDGVSLSLVGAGSNGAGGIAGPAVLQGGRGFSAADGGDVYVQGGTVAGAGQQGGVRIGDISGAYVAIGKGDGQSTTIAGDLQIYGNGAGDIEIENGSGTINFASPVTGLGINNLRTLTTSGTIATSDRVLNCNAASGNQTHALPNPATMDPGQCILIKKISTGANTISLSRFAAENIEGTSATFLLPGSAGTGRPAWTLYTDGTDWFVA